MRVLSPVDGFSGRVGGGPEILESQKLKEGRR
jgi:hypothetical protein